MKNKLSKRIFALFLAVLMAVTSVPFLAFAYEKPVSTGGKYLFAYFTSNSQYGQQLRFAVSEDGLNYTPLNLNRPIIEHTDDGYFEQITPEANKQYQSLESSSSGYIRDPYIFKAHDGSGYYIIGTDMDASSGGMHESWTGDTCFVVFHSDDLVNWYQISVFNVAQFSAFSTTIRAWAPQVIWDETEGKYMVYWANYLSDWSEAVYYSYTTDFSTYETPQLLYKPETGAAIDADIIYDGNGTYYMYYKDETNATVGYVTSSALTGPYTGFTACSLSDKAVEGNSMFNITGTDSWIMMLDEYLDGSFIFQITTDFKNFELMDLADYNIRRCSARHGSVVAISDEEYQALCDAYLIQDQSNEITYAFTNEYNTSQNGSWYQNNLQDANGDDAGPYTFDLAVSGPTYSTTFGNTPNPYATIGNGNLDMYFTSICINDERVHDFIVGGDFTVSFDYTLKADSLTIDTTTYADWRNYSNIFAISLGNSYDLIRLNANGDLSVASDTNGTMVTQRLSRIPNEGETISYKITFDGASTVVYMDGVEVGRINSSIPGFVNTNHYVTFGRPDGYLANNSNFVQPYARLSNLSFRDVALDVTEAKLDQVLFLDDLESCVYSFETLLNSGNVYLNTPDAYKYYEEAIRLIEVRDYGTADVTEQMATCYTNLKAAIENMKLWKVSDYRVENMYTTFVDQAEVGTNVLAASGNTLFNSSQEVGGWVLDSNDPAGESNTEVEFWYNNHRWFDNEPAINISVYGDSYISLYNGEDDIKMPLKFRWYREDYSTGRSRGLKAIYLANNNLELVGQQSNAMYMSVYGDNDVTNSGFIWPSGGTYNIPTFNTGASAGNAFSDGSTGHHYAFGYANLTGTFGENDYLMTIDPNVVFIDMNGNYISFGNNGMASVASGSKIDYDNNISLSDSLCNGGSATYYVINIVPLINALQEGAQKLTSADISTFAYADMLSAFESAQAMMEYNPWEVINGYKDSNTGYIDRATMATVSQTVASQIETLVNDYEDTMSLIDTDGYASLEALRTNPDINQTYGLTNDETMLASLNYTTDSWNTFTDAYEVAVAKVNELQTVNFEKELNADGITENTAINEIVVDVYQAYYGLRKRADFEDVQKVQSTESVSEVQNIGLGDRISLDNNNNVTVNQNYTISSWIKFANAYQAVTDFNKAHPDASVEPMYASEIQEITTNGYTFTVEVEQEGVNSDVQQKAIDLTKALNDSVTTLKAPDAADRYDTYNIAQSRAELADLDAYSAEGKAVIESNFAMGYISSTGEEKYITEYNADSDQVYVRYNDGVYVNTVNGETDSLTAQVINDINTESYLKTYKVEFNVVIDGAEKQLISTDNYTYGENVMFDGSAYSDGTYDIAKWEIKSVNAQTSVIKETAFTVDRMIQEDTEVTLYLTTKNADATKVTVVDYFGTVLDVGYVNLDGNNFVYTTGADNALVYEDASGRTHTVAVNHNGGYYTFSDWYWSFSGNAGDEVLVYQRGTSTVPQGIYTVQNGTVNGSTQISGVNVNTALTFETSIDNFYAWIKSENLSTWYVASYDQTFETLARNSKGITYMAVTEEQIGQYITDATMLKDVTTYKVPFSFGTAAETVNVNGTEKFRLFCDYTISSTYGDIDTSDIEIVQCGVLAARGDSAPADFTKGADGVTAVVANDVSDYNTYTMTTSYSNATNTYMRSFVCFIYKDGQGNIEGSKQFPRIAYGPVVCCDSTGAVSTVSY